MSTNLILIPTAPRSHENDQSSTQSIHDCIAIDLLTSGNTSAHNPCLQANAVNGSLYNSLVINAGGVA